LENTQNEIKIIESGDGSHTLLHSTLNETYHSMHGAVQESEHVFIRSGLEPLIPAKKTIRIFEVGFGTGLNAWLTYKKVENSDTKIIYHSLEPFPLKESIYTQLNYTKSSENKNLQDFFLQIHQAEWNKEVELNNNFILKKIKLKLEDYTPVDQNFDLVYYDAFAPSKQAEVWLPENLQKVYALLTKEGILVTYCARGQFKRDLKEIGFLVETLPGPPGKKEMTRGKKISGS
jgi:tRNA U34 5-methylaminomethyl-2-thiouridine-forming methyltransferase MnmC